MITDYDIDCRHYVLRCCGCGRCPDITLCGQSLLPSGGFIYPTETISSGTPVVEMCAGCVRVATARRQVATSRARSMGLQRAKRRR